jgi:hypothetical protein
LLEDFQRIHAVRRLSSAERWLGCIWVSVLSVIEIVGRHFSSDFGDMLALLTVFLLAYVTRIIHRRRHLPVVAALGSGIRHVWRQVVGAGVEVGVDFRKYPPIPRGFPGTWLWACVILALLVPGLLWIAPAFPSRTRAILGGQFYLGSLALEALLWLALAYGVLVHSFLAWGGLHDWLVVRHRDQLPRPIGTEARATVALFGSLFIAGALLPAAIPVAAHALFLVTACAAAAVSSAGPETLWRYRRGGSVRAFDGRWLPWASCVGLCLVGMNLMIASLGESLWQVPFARQWSAAPVTMLLGRIFAWFSVAGGFVATCFTLTHATIGLMFRAARSADRPDSAMALEARRTEIQHRREIIRRLQMLFRRAAREKGQVRRGFGSGCSIGSFWGWREIRTKVRPSPESRRSSLMLLGRLFIGSSRLGLATILGGSLSPFMCT